MRFCLLLLLYIAAQIATAAPPTPGLYYDRTRDGHGLDLQVAGNHVVGAFFTYAADGQPY